MSLLSKITDFVGGSVFKEAKDLIKDYFPPDLSPEKAQEFEIKWAELQAKKSQEAGQLANETLALELADVQDARKNHNQSRMPACIVAGTTLLVALLAGALVMMEIPDRNRDILIQISGAILMAWGGSIQYFVGTTRSSAVKTDIISRL